MVEQHQTGGELKFFVHVELGVRFIRNRIISSCLDTKWKQEPLVCSFNFFTHSENMIKVANEKKKENMRSQGTPPAFVILALELVEVEVVL